MTEPTTEDPQERAKALIEGVMASAVRRIAEERKRQALDRGNEHVMGELAVVFAGRWLFHHVKRKDQPALNAALACAGAALLNVSAVVAVRKALEARRDG